MCKVSKERKNISGFVRRGKISCLLQEGLLLRITLETQCQVKTGGKSLYGDLASMASPATAVVYSVNGKERKR